MNEQLRCCVCGAGLGFYESDIYADPECLECIKAAEKEKGE